MTPDTTPDIISIRDDARPLRDGTIERSKVIGFYLGKFGPFTERFPADVDDATIRARMQQVRTTIENLHR